MLLIENTPECGTILKLNDVSWESKGTRVPPPKYNPPSLFFSNPPNKALFPGVGWHVGGVPLVISGAVLPSYTSHRFGRVHHLALSDHTMLMSCLPDLLEEMLKGSLYLLLPESILTVIIFWEGGFNKNCKSPE